MKIISDKNLHHACESLMARLRAYPEDGQLAKSVFEVGRLIQKHISNLGKGIPEFEKEFVDAKVIDLRLPEMKIRRSSGFQVSEKLRVRVADTEDVTVEENDIRLMSQVYLFLGYLITHKNPKMIAEFADAFHGLSVAVLDKDLNRAKYKKIYFDRFLSKWNQSIPAGFLQEIDEWEHGGK